MFSTLRSRLWLSYAFIIVTALGVVAMILFVFLLRNPILSRQTLERLRAVQMVVKERENVPESQSITMAAEKASQTFGVRVLLYSREKQLTLDTYADTEAPLPFPKQRILTRNTTPLVRDENGANWLYSIEKLPDGSFLMVASPRPRFSILNVFNDEFLPIILQGGLIALLLSLVLAFFVARWIADPLQKVVLAARTLPSDEIRPVETRGPHEVQELTRAFNAMIARMQASQRSQREFVANVSHELKTPLTSIQGFAQAILDGTADSNESRQQAAQVIYTESGRMHRLVLDLLDLARLDAGTADMTMSPVHLQALLSAVAEKFSPQLQRAGVNIEVKVLPDLPTVTADGDRMAQVFTNLVDNALKFTPRDGLITMQAAVLNNEIQVSVTDSGTGIPEEAQAKIFTRFYQADPARRGGEKHGAGLGLAIAREIVLAHGGRISVRSGLGEGTTFDVFLPLIKPRLQK
ncbi:MAG: HAMP domain-containing histidine kinase [Anaerolineales bacterium]|nr:HAMP domain-containing histidine kinase [Anaerolineales bacterium]